MNLTKDFLRTLDTEACTDAAINLSQAFGWAQSAEGAAYWKVVNDKLIAYAKLAPYKKP